MTKARSEVSSEGRQDQHDQHDQHDRQDRRGQRVILHVDMDAFYVSVETLLNPSLRGKPVVVGGDGARGVVASCSYEARAFGIRSAMPSVRAKRLCPHAIFLRGNHKLYAEYSATIHEVFQSFTPIIEPIALDEAFLDLSNATKLFGNGRTAAAAIRTAVFDATGLWCSVGVATNKLLAKLASKDAKPPIGAAPERVIPGAVRTSAGVLEVLPGLELSFLHPQPARALWGIGPKTFERLQRFGVNTIGDLAQIPLDALTRSLGDATAQHLHSLANGLDDRKVEPDRGVKSIGHEETFSHDHFVTDTLEVELLRMADAVAARMRKSNLRGRTVNLKLKTSDFRSFTRARTLAQPIDTARVMHRTVVELLRTDDVIALVKSSGIRLIGVSMSNLVERNDPAAALEPHVDVDGSSPKWGGREPQMSLFDEPLRSGDGRREPLSEVVESAADTAVAETVDAIRARFGAKAVGPATFAQKGRNQGLRVKEEGDTQWGPAGS